MNKAKDNRAYPGEQLGHGLGYRAYHCERHVGSTQRANDQRMKRPKGRFVTGAENPDDAKPDPPTVQHFPGWRRGRTHRFARQSVPMETGKKTPGQLRLKVPAS